MSLNRSKNETKEMFDSISGQYDLINNLLTFGLHNKWKSEIVKIAKKKNPRKILDMATGTADIAFTTGSGSTVNCIFSLITQAPFNLFVTVAFTV